MRRAERGQAGGIEVLAFGFLFFVAGTLLLANVWAVIDAKTAAVAAAREAARTYVESPGPEAGTAAAARAAEEAVAGHGRNPERMGSLDIEAAGGFERCAVVTVRVTYRVPAVVVPWLGGFGDGFEVAARHSERVDPFRDDVGTAGREATCG